jgi:hypothetical protein
MLRSPGIGFLDNRVGPGQTDVGSPEWSIHPLTIVIDIGNGEDKHSRNFSKCLLYRIPGLCPISSSPSEEGRHHRYYSTRGWEGYCAVKRGRVTSHVLYHVSLDPIRHIRSVVPKKALTHSEHSWALSCIEKSINITPSEFVSCRLQLAQTL